MTPARKSSVLDSQGKRSSLTKPPEFKAPIGLDTIFSFLKGVKIKLKNIHIRFEDSFNRVPISIGFQIEEIDFATTESHWNFASFNSCRFKRKPNKYINKEFSIYNLAVYVENGILLPPDLYESTLDHPYEIFSELDPEAVKAFMNKHFN